MKKYEAVFILDERKVDDAGKAFAEEFGAFITGLKGEMNETVAMGRRQFAREIRRRKSGVYWDFVFTLDPAAAGGVRDRYRLDERIIRLQVFHYDRPAPLPPRAQEEGAAPAVPAAPVAPAQA